MKKIEPKKTKTSVKVALIGLLGMFLIAIATIIASRINKSKNSNPVVKTRTIIKTDTILVDKKESPYCLLKRKKTKCIAKLIDNQLLSTNDQRYIINLKYYKEKIDDIIKYDCEILTREKQNIDSIIMVMF